MFNGAQNVVIEDGMFVVYAHTSKKDDIGRIIWMAAPNAILNAGGRADEVRCYPGTRKEVIGKVEKWMTSAGDGSCTNRIMWLSGPAGAGKSAICQTLAERCPRRGQQAANFFFFRSDHTRNSAQALITTLIYQLRDFYPTLDEVLTDCLKAHPLICNASIADQFLHLITSPMQTIRQASSTYETIVLIIDGLDECDDSRKQDEILIALRALADADDSQFLVLISSRADPHLIMSFNQLGTSVESIFLDDEYRPQEDIRRFVAAKFDEIKRLHHLKQMLRADWPAKSDIDAITNKSSGQFIYAATVMRFIKHSPESPDISLVLILEMQPAARYNPLAQLDAVYSYIFSKVRDMHSVKLILCAYFIIVPELRYPAVDEELDELLKLVGYGPVQVTSLFANLGAIIQVTAHPLNLVFYHASLHDYLKDEYRSGSYYVDMGEIAANFSAICLRNFHDTSSFNWTALCLKYAKEATAELSKSLLDTSSGTLGKHWVYLNVEWPLFLCNIERLYFQTNRRLFKKILQRWVRFSYVNNISPSMDVGMESLAASWYYKWYLFVERGKFMLKLNR